MIQRSLPNELWFRFLRLVCRLTAVLVYNVRHTGVSNIPREGGVLVVSNHQSHFDPPLVGMGPDRRMNYVARKSLFGFGPFRWLINSLDAIPIDREKMGLAGIKESLRRLKRGEMVVVFPEGTRTPDGEIHRFRPGFTTLAVRSRAAILPVAIEGAYAVWPRRQKLPRLGHIHVHYGPPILADEVARLDERELLREVERRVRACHALLRARPVFSGKRGAVGVSQLPGGGAPVILPGSSAARGEPHA
jgi:1-acyl-sn-glycerol-3-phosphate acyltransferase